ncbi:hypothetical protein SEA_LITTLELAF_106 [Mycobacterium phage LittleLaf]|uniref:Uncharacterized protein n=1 Tax=Mycobacterium phage LittleLaf TaxID=2301615 RepID=A0A385UG55_9CAUD|nr:hypothetical protein SEA_LITTLELAF_106 [Mycobacterium phage LittleLaf]
MMNQPTTRQLVRNETAQLGWSHHEGQWCDYFRKPEQGDVVITTMRSKEDSERLIVGALRLEGDHFLTDYSPMCIIRCRQWLGSEYV